MIIRIAEGGAITVDEGADCKRLHVEAADPDSAGAALESAGAGRGADDLHVQLDAMWLRETSDADPDDFDAMLAYAEAKGWVDAGTHIRAHVVQA